MLNDLKWRHARLSFAALLYGVILLCGYRVGAQDYTIQNVIPTPPGSTPQYALISHDGSRLFVANTGTGVVLVIDTGSDTVVRRIDVGRNPHGLLLSHDGRRLYGIADADANEDCSTRPEKLFTIETAGLTVTGSIPILGRVDALALTRDDQHLYIARVCHEVDVIDLPGGQPHVSIESLKNPGGYPVGILISPDGRHMFVNYQFFGPYSNHGYLAHDALVEFDVTSGDLLRAQHSVPNVGDQIALSPNGTQIWSNGVDACSRPDYPHEGCPSVPSRVINALRVSDDPAQTLSLLKTFAFSLDEFNGRISIAPQGDVFVGGGVYLKRIDQGTLEIKQRIHLPAAGDVAFSPDGRIAYVTVGEKDEIVVLTRNKAPNPTIQTEVSALPISTLDSVVLRQNLCQQEDCRCPPNDQECLEEEREGKRTPTELQAGRVTDLLVTRGIRDQNGEVHRLPSSDDDWPCIWGYRDGELTNDQAETLREFINRTDHYKLISFEGRASTTPDGVQRITVPNPNIHDLTSFRKGLGEHAVYLTVISCRDRVQTVLYQQTGPTIIASATHTDTHKPYSRAEVRKLVATFRSLLESPCSSLSQIRQIGSELYNIILPSPIRVNIAHRPALTLTWALRDQLRYIPMGALWDGDHYLVEKYVNAIETPNSGGSTDENDAFVALAAGDSNQQQTNQLAALPNVPNEIRDSFTSAEASDSGKIPATILLDNGGGNTQAFSPENLSIQLRALELIPARRRIVHIASHFILQGTAKDSYLLTQTGPLPYNSLSDKSRYPFAGIWLVTLSACKTGFGTASNNRDGSEIESWAYNSDAAGAESTIATLWEIQDAVSRQLMRGFYAELGKGSSKGKALQGAQLSVLNETGPIKASNARFGTCITSYSHPYFWAPFFLIGAWK